MPTVGELNAQLSADITRFRRDMRGGADEVRRTEKAMAALQSQASSTGQAIDQHGKDVSTAGKHLALFAGHIAAGIAAEEAFRAGLRKSGIAVGKHTAATNVLINTTTGATAATAKLTSGLRTSAKVILTRLLPPIAALAGVAGIAGLTKRLTEFGKSAANIAPVASAFDNLAEHVGTTGDALREDLSAAVAGTVPDFELMKSSVIALNSEAIRSPEVLTELARSARILGRTVGLDTTDAFDNLIRGIGLMNPQLLKSVGVLVSVDEAYRNYAESVHKSIADLTDAEKHHAFLVEVLDEVRAATGRVGDETDDMQTTLQQAAAASLNFDRAMRRAVAEAENLQGVNQDIVQIKTGLTELGRNTLPRIAQSIANIVGLLGQLATDPLARALSGERGPMLGLAGGFQDAASAAEEWEKRHTAAMKAAAEEASRQGQRIRDEIVGLSRLEAGIESDAGLIQRARDRQRFRIPGVTGIPRPDEPLFDVLQRLTARAEEQNRELEEIVASIPDVEIRFGPQIAELLRNPARIQGRLSAAIAGEGFVGGFQTVGRITGPGMPAPDAGSSEALGIRRGTDFGTINAAARAVSSLASASGALSTEATDAFRGVSDITGGISALADESASTATQILGGAGLVGGIISLGTALFDFGDAAAETARVVANAMADLDLSIKEFAGTATDVDRTFARAARLAEELDRAVPGMDLRPGLSFEQAVREGLSFEEAFEIGDISDAFDFAHAAQALGLSTVELWEQMAEDWQAILQGTEDNLAGLGDEAARVAETFRILNKPRGFKVNLARFRATDPTGPIPGPNEPNTRTEVQAPTYIIQIDGRTIFEIMENEARRSGSRGSTAGITVTRTRDRV